MDMVDDEAAERKYRAPALEKGLDILELLSSVRNPMPLSQICNQLNRSTSELFRMVQVLEARGYLISAKTGDGYVLSDRLFALGISKAPTRDLLEVALPIMRRFSEQVSQSAHLVVASADQMVVVARIEAPGDLGFSVRIGYRRPLVSAASGLVLYAFQSLETRKEWRARLSGALDDAGWRAFDEHAEIARADGYVRSDSTAVKGIVDLSAPVRSLDGVWATLTCPFVATAQSISIPDTISMLVVAANQISAELGGGEPPSLSLD